MEAGVKKKLFPLLVGVGSSSWHWLNSFFALGAAAGSWFFRDMVTVTILILEAVNHVSSYLVTQHSLPIFHERLYSNFQRWMSWLAQR